jgi:hypothetical protein
MPTQVFISWSGNLSKKLAEAVREWLPATLQFVKPYFTPVDIEKGSKWGAEISGELDRSNIGVICLTSENLNNPWILFEAGALSKKLESRVCTILFGVDPSSVTGPLTLFQHTRFTKEDFKKLVETINSTGGESRLSESVLKTVFEKFWPDLEETVNKILAEYTPADTGEPRQERDILEEILELTRSHIQREQAQERSVREGYGRALLEDLLGPQLIQSLRAREERPIYVKLGDESTKSFTTHVLTPPGDVASLLFSGPPSVPSTFQDRPKGG